MEEKRAQKFVVQKFRFEMQMIDDLEIRKEIITAMPSRFLFSDFCDQTPEWRHFYPVWSKYVFLFKLLA